MSGTTFRTFCIVIFQEIQYLPPPPLKPYPGAVVRLHKNNLYTMNLDFKYQLKQQILTT